MTHSLTFLAGKRALDRIRDGGLTPEMVEVVAGAAGGPKWLVLGGLDRYLFGEWFSGRRRPLYFLGASIGSWRFAAAAQPDPVAALDVFEAAYIAQRYTSRPTPAEVTTESRRIMAAYLDNGAVDAVLRHPQYRLSFMAVRCRALTARDTPAALGAGLLLAAAGNLVHRRFLGLFFERALVRDGRGTPPFVRMNGFPIHRIPLTRNNFRPMLLASGSIPLVMSGVTDAPDTPPGTYRDGGVIDYHLDVDFNVPEGRVVLYPHFMTRIIPGWLDKRLTWRQPSAERMADVLLAAPSPDFVANLPLGKIPDRTDFYRFAGRDDERIACWKTAIAASRRMAEDFAEAVLSGRIRDRVRPLTNNG